MKTEVNQLTKKMRRLINRDQKEYWTKQAEAIVEEKDCGKKWKIINNLMETKRESNTPLSHLIKPDGSMTSNLQEIVNQHAKRLANTHTPRRPAASEAEWMEEMKNDNQMNFSALCPMRPSEEDGDDIIEEAFHLNSLVDSINELKTKSAPGDDDVTNEQLKKIPNKVVLVIHRLFILLVNIGYFPRPWKRARIKMLPKPNRCVKDSSNYRPISLLSNMGKLFEKLIKKTVDKSTSVNQTIPELHSGFRRGRCTQETFVRMAEKIASTRRQKGITIALAVDIEKAFDKLDHSVVKYQLRRLNLSFYSLSRLMIS